MVSGITPTLFLNLPQPGEVYIPPDCQQRCTCVDGDLVCVDLDCDANAVCETRGGVHQCYCNEGFQGNGTYCERGMCLLCLVEEISQCIPTSFLA